MLSFIRRIILLLCMSVIASIPVALFFALFSVILRNNGIEYIPIMGLFLCWVFFGGAISWAISKIFAKHIMKVQIISPGEKDPMLAKVLQIVETTSIRAGLKDIPQAGYYVSTEINAFASGPSKSNALIAVSTGLLNAMNDAQLEGVVAHEVSHIQQGDMVTMTVMQGAVNAEILFLSYFICHILGIKSENSQIGIHLFEVSFGMMTVNSFSRRREFRADEGSARLYGKDKIISALKVLQKNSGNTGFDQHTSLAPFKIYGNTTAFRRLLATHPPIEERIKRLEELPENEKSETEKKPEIADNAEETNTTVQNNSTDIINSDKTNGDIQAENSDKTAENKSDKPKETENKEIPIKTKINKNNGSNQ